MSAPPAAQLFAAARQALDRGQLDHAETFARRVLAQHADHPGALSLLGLVAMRRSDPDAAIDWQERAVAADGRNPGLRCMLAEALVVRSRFDEAMEQYDAALTAHPDHEDALAGRAEILDRRGETDEARSLLARLVTTGAPSPKAAQLHAAMLVRHREHADAVTFIESQLGRPAIAGPRRRALLFLLGDARDRQDDPDGAFAAYVEANRIGERPFELDAFERHVEALMATFARDRLGALPRGEAAPAWPVYIVGLPRCGSTLIEQILHAHPGVEGTGEIPDVGRAIQRLLGAAAPRYPAALADIAPDRMRSASRVYLDGFRGRGPDADRLVDKNLGNFRRLGPLSMLVPGARVIHARRDPVDHCFSCFMNNLSPVTHRYASTLERMAGYFRTYERLMAFWRETLDLRILDVVYEDVVAAPEAQSRRIVEFLGLPWDDACLRFHEVDRAVSTLSREQVRRPIYRTAVARSDRYREHLGPLRAALEK